jgi:fusobacterium outer membrane protein family
MNNTLRQLEKNLRTFAKRCKGISYNKTLLFTFLFTGLTGYVLKAAPSDAEETLQKDVNATILDLRQSFKRTKEQNEKFLENANLEMAQLMMQGEQVIKSNWTSWQFGFGGMFNTQLSRYRGFGGKSDDIKYSRTNDLTKYVFDANQNHWNATTLDIKKNKEPDSKSIDPADIHQGYEPNTVTKLDRVKLLDDVNFNVAVTAPPAGYYGFDRQMVTPRGYNAITGYEINTNTATRNDHRSDQGGVFVNTANANNWSGNAIASSGAVTFTSGPATVTNADKAEKAYSPHSANVSPSGNNRVNNAWGNAINRNDNSTVHTTGSNTLGSTTPPPSTYITHTVDIGAYFDSNGKIGAAIVDEAGDTGVYKTGNGRADVTGSITGLAGSLGAYLDGGTLGVTTISMTGGSTGIRQAGGTSEIGTLTVGAGGLGMKLTGGNNNNTIGTLNFSGTSTGLGLLQSGAGMTITNMDVTNNSIGAIVSGGTLSLTNATIASGSTGVVVQTGGTLHVGNNFKVADGGTGVIHSGGSINSGTITLNGGGIGMVTNGGSIGSGSGLTISSSSNYNKVGVYGTATAPFTNYATITLRNAKNYGIVYGGTVDNHRDITLSNTDAGSIGIKANGVTNSNSARISVSGPWGSLMGIDSGNSVTLNSGSVTVNGGDYDSNTGVRSVTGGVTVGTNASVSVSGRHYSQGVHSENGLVTVNGSVGVTGSYSNGVLNTAGASPNADITVNNGTVSTTGSYNNALYTLNGKITVQNTSNISATGGSHNNAVYAPNNATTVDQSTITIGTSRSNYNNTGVNLVKSGVNNSITNTGFNINSNSSIGIRVAEHGAGTTVSDNSFYIGSQTNNVDYSVGVYVAPGKEITGVSGNSSTSYGTHNTGILVSSYNGAEGKAATISGGRHTINGTYSNGIELDTKTDTIISGVTFDVLGNHSTGLVAGRHWDKDDPMANLVVSGSIFNVSGGVSNSTSGIYLDNVKKTKIDPTTYMYVANASTGIELINSGRDTREIEIGRGNVSMHLGRNDGLITGLNKGGNNIGVNIVSDKIVKTNAGTLGFVDSALADKKKVNIHGFLDIYTESDYNTLFNNQGYADELKIENGDVMYPTSVAGNGVIKIGRTRLYNGQNVEAGNNRNTVFANLGYVKGTGSKIDLNHIEIDGDNNKVAFFNTTLASSSHGTAIPTWSYTKLGKIGWFAGSVALQGIVGYSNGNDLVTSSNNVGVYAISGQRSEINPQVNIGHHSATSLPDLTVSDINIGFSRHSVNGTLVYAGKGTAVSVANATVAGTATTSGMVVANTITDGVYIKPNTTLHRWGYDTPYRNTSLSTTLMRADGVWLNEEYDGHGNLTGGHRLLVNNGDTFLYKPSEIKVNSNVDMTSRKGTAYLATNGGRVTVGATTANHTRASGYESIIAYAQGIHAKSRDDSADDVFPIVNDAGYKQKGSRVTITGGITAADNSIIGNEQANYSLPERVNTYKNIAAYASNNGDILIQGATVNTPATGVQEAANTTAGTAKSLIYGMAAYATGEGSNVVYSDKSGKEAAATVVTGEHGALFAERGGYIEFSGDIVHQNNAQDQITQDATNGYIKGTRRGRGVITGTPNDHTNLPVFYARRTANTVNEGKTAIVFNRTTNIDMYDGILLAGNNYYHGPGAGNWDFNGGYSDYYKGKTAAAGESNEYNAAKYRGMENVTVRILQTYDGVNGVNLGLINQAKEELNWDSSRDGSSSGSGTSANYLAGVAKYAGIASILNPTNATANPRSTSHNAGFVSTLINSKLKIKEDVNLENNYVNQYISHDKTTDPFNNITMEGVLVTNEQKTISGDVATGYRAGQGLNMANSLYRYDDSELILNPATATYRRSKNDEAGYNNFGKVNVWGGTARGNVQITGINVANATVNNGNDDASKKGEVTIDHGYGIAGSDNSVIRNKKDSKITVTGKYDPKGQDATNGYISEARTRLGYAKETEATGENYGIVGLSTNNARDHRNYGSGRYGENAIAIENIEGKIKVDGDLAVGIYAANKKYDDGTDGADQNRVTIKYDNKNAAAPNLIDLNNGSTDKEKRDIGIALVNEVKDMANPANRGGIITLNTKNTVATPDFVTKYRGIGIYGESTDIKFQNGSTGLTVETKNDGAGIWLTDDSHVGVTGDHNSRTYNYTYTGDNDKKGFGMVFSSTMAGSNTVAENHLNIKFKNSGSTKEGIAGILVNTDAGDWVKNYGKITEDPLQTTAKSFGAVVNKGTFENHGDITLHDSADIKKANVGIFANSHDNPVENIQTHIINYGDIKVGTPGQTQSFGIYGYNITHDKRADGTGGTITIGKESYGVYSGDGNVNIKGGKFTVGTNTVTTADERATGVYIEDNSRLTRMARTSEISADMEIDDYSFGIVVKKNTNAELPGAANTHAIRIGAGSYGLDANGKVNSLIRTKIPEITLGRAASTDPVSPSSPTNLLTNAVYYHSQDKLSTLDSFADIKMNGDYNYAYYTAGSVNNYGNIDLRSNVDLLANGGLGNRNAEGSIKGYGNVGIYSTNYNVPSTNFGTITTGASDLVNEEYSAAMAAGHYIPGVSANSGRAEKEGYIINRGIINVQEHNGIGMFAVGANSIAKNYGTINLVGNNSIGMYLDQRAKGENYGTIVSEAGSGTGIKGVVAINGAYIKNYGTIKILSPFGKGIVTSNRQVLDDNENSDVTGTQENIQLIAGTNEKTTGDGSTIKVPDLVPLTEVTINGVNTPIFKLDTTATVASPIASHIIVKGSIQTGGTRIIDLSTWGNFGAASRSEITRIGMYIDTSGVRYTNPIDGIENLHHLNEIDLLFGTEATQYTNAKAIELGENILKPYNDALRDAVAGGAILNPISASITWMAKDIKDPLTKLLKSVYLVKVPYTSFALKGDENTYIFAENLEEKYETAKGNDKIIFNKVNDIGNGEGHILAQAFDEMKGHQYSNIQQRMQKTSDLLGTELDQLKNVWYNSSKDSNKIKSFGMKGEYKTDSATVRDYSNNAYGVAYVHEFETIRLGERTGFYAGAIYNRYNFKDIGHSKEDQYMMKAGLFRTTPFDENGTLTWTISGDGFISINEMKRRFWIVDDTFKAHSNYAAYGVTVNNEIGKEFGSIANGFDGFGVRLYGGLKLEYGRFTKIKEKGDMPLELKANGYYSARPEVGVQFKYRQPIFRGKTDFIAGLGFAFENELGKTGDVHNKARIRDTFKNYYSLTGEKDNKKGNFKSDLQLGLDNQRLGFTVNFGYDTKGNNMRGGLGFRAIY